MSDPIYVALIKVWDNLWHVVAIDTNKDALMDALADTAQNFHPTKEIVRNNEQVFFADGNAGDNVVGYITDRNIGDYSFVDRLNRLAKTMQEIGK